MDERIERAFKESEKQPVSKEKVCSLTKQALYEKGINGRVNIIRMEEIDDFDIPTAELDGSDSVIFIQFTQSGHVAVVGAGKDYVSNPLYCGRESTPVILKKMREKYINTKSENDFCFDVDSIILITIDGLIAKGYNKAKTILKSRNGIEQYIGEYLQQHDVAILNVYQHWNFKKSIFELLE